MERHRGLTIEPENAIIVVRKVGLAPATRRCEMKLFKWYGGWKFPVAALPDGQEMEGGSA
jgi:hypothetical protein